MKKPANTSLVFDEGNPHRKQLLLHYLEGRINERDLVKLNAAKLDTLVPALDTLLELVSRYATAENRRRAAVMDTDMRTQFPELSTASRKQHTDDVMNISSEMQQAHQTLVAALNTAFPAIKARPKTGPNGGWDWLSMPIQNDLLRNKLAQAIDMSPRI